MRYHSKYEICTVAGHAWESRNDEYGQWNECARCGTLGPRGSSGRDWVSDPFGPRVPRNWPPGLRWNYGRPFDPTVLRK